MPDVPRWAARIVGVVAGITAVVVAVEVLVEPAGDLAVAIKSQLSRLYGEPTPITFKAVKFSSSSNVAPAGTLTGPDGPYGDDVLINFPPQSVQPNMAEWNIEAPQAGHYRLYVQYASGATAMKDLRPVKILVNGEEWCDDRLSKPTGCWSEKCQDWKEQGVLPLQEGANTIRIESAPDNIFPHIKTLRLTWTRDKVVCFNLD